MPASNEVPWVCYGQTQVDLGQSVFDPAPNVNGLIGEVMGLPYLVPVGCDLWLENYGIEAYPGCPGGIVLAPFISDFHPGELPEEKNRQFLHSVNAGWAGTVQATGLRYVIPAGKTLHVMLQNGGQPAAVYGWFLAGTLRAKES